MVSKIEKLFNVEYKILAGTLDITNLFEQATITHANRQYSVKFSGKLKNIKRDDGWIHRHVYLGKPIIVKATFDGETQVVFAGTVYRWNTIADKHMIDIDAYDHLYKTLQSDEHFYFKEGISASSRVSTVCGDMGLPIKKNEGLSASLSKGLYTSSIADTLKEIVRENNEKSSNKVLIRSELDGISFVEIGSNSKVYEITDWTVNSSNDEHSIEDLVTVVKIYGNKDGDERPPVVATKNGRTEFGKIQRIIYDKKSDGASGEKSANDIANEILKKEGKPIRVNTIDEHPIIPFIKKGDKIKVASGTIGSIENGKAISQDRYVKAIAYSLKDLTMSLELTDERGDIEL